MPSFGLAGLKTLVVSIRAAVVLCTHKGIRTVIVVVDVNGVCLRYLASEGHPLINVCCSYIFVDIPNQKLQEKTLIEDGDCL